MTSDRSDATLNEATCEGKKDSLAFKRDEEKAKEGNEARAKGEPVDGEKVFEPNPIETVRIGGHRVTSHGSGRPMSLQQSKSYGDGHGFTCFSNEERDAERASTADRHAAGEVFEVQWEGDNDAANPRSMGRLRKWMIVLIVSSSSACV